MPHDAPRDAEPNAVLEPERAAAVLDFPFLGEPLTLEFANTLYRPADGATIDYLGTPQAADAWFTATPGARDLAPYRPVTARVLRDLHALRHAAISLIESIVDGIPVDSEQLAVVNGFAARAPAYPALSFTGTVRSVTQTHVGAETDLIVARLAGAIITFVASADATAVQRCERPGCPMFFVRQHHRRRFCCDDCSHRMRQARYYRSVASGRSRTRASIHHRKELS